MNRTGIPYLDLCWNPGGFGCSGGCPTCWARRMTRSPACPVCDKCRAFNVHLHPERLEGKLAPAQRKKPAVVGVQFTGDLFDDERPESDICSVLSCMLQAPQHAYVLLTQNALKARHVLGDVIAPTLKLTTGQALLPDNWFVGVTIRHAPDLHLRLPRFKEIPGRLWLSLEPLASPVLALGALLAGRCGVEGVVIGHDNTQKSESLAAVRNAAQQATASGVAVYVKQIWLWHCPRCENTVVETLAGHRTCPICGLPHSQFVLRLTKDAAQFPEDLRLRQLPWTPTLGTEGQGPGRKAQGGAE